MPFVLEKESRFVDQALDIIAEEVGIDRDELCDDAEFEDFGVDAILARIITDRLANSTGVDVGPAALQYGASVSSFKQQVSEAAIRRQNIKPQKRQAIVPIPVVKSKSLGSVIIDNPSQPLAIRLQGNPNARQKVFLLPDGSGSGMAYVQTPNLGPDTCLYGLNSPLLHRPTPFHGTIEDLAKVFAAEIRKVQPYGPYTLGGWSAGGYHAFEVTKQLIREGQAVEKLILIDSPCRLVFEALPMEVVDYLATNNLMGNWGSKKTPEWLVKHFDDTIAAVGKYVPTPMDFPAAQMPEVFIIWASDVVLAKGQARHTGLDLSKKVTRFLLEDRPHFGPHGWDELFPGRDVAIAKMPGHHFEVIHPPSVSSILRMGLNL
ncbi:alpha/beta-hydrolase [Hypoxylon rubiginosum]|uniref:Alpha/beta-hydrolase n=1 Tax=Hypoxylon rubiginosum TaxID=110542 RepID=A0ACC0DIQ0_9PEZI|nr:alpha/beta-hydrolase [Hypoxylon rubiginosum]